MTHGTAVDLDLPTTSTPPILSKTLRFAGLVLGPLLIAAATALIALQFINFFLQTLMGALQSDILAATAAVLTFYVGRSSFLGLRRFLVAKIK